MDHEHHNTEAARLILGDAAEHGGPDSLMVRWAQLWTERHGGQQQARQADHERTASGQLALFQMSACEQTGRGFFSKTGGP